MKVAICICCYNNEQEIIEYAKCIKNQKCSFDIDLLVNINKSNNIEWLEYELGKVDLNYKIYYPNENIGYINGNLFGLREGESNIYDWSIISNTDLRFLSEVELENLFIFENDDIACIAPNIRIDNSSVYQNPFMEDVITLKKLNFYRKLYRHPIIFQFYSLLSNLKVKFNKGKSFEAKQKMIYAPHGSFFALRKEVIDEMLQDSIDIFMYGEELYVGEIVRKLDKKVLYNPNCNIIHMCSSTTKLTNARTKVKWYSHSFEFIYHKFFENNK